MKIQCENCAIQHELDPPSWVVSSGRAFRFRCSSCGHSQSVQPTVAAEASGPARMEEMVVPSEVERSSPTLSPPEEDAPPEIAGASSAAVFLKQNGQIYMVRDWDTLKRWIEERRVDRHDLVSEGGVRWEPIGSRADLLPHFQKPTGPAPVAPGASTPFPFGGETPFGQAPSDASHAWHDDDTEGIPTGLPPLPTEEAFPPTSRTILPLEEPAPPALLEDVTETPAPPEAAPSYSAPAPTAPGAVRPRIARPTPTMAPGDWDDLLVPDDAPSPKAPPPVAEEPQDQAWDTPARSGTSSQVLYGGLVVATLVLGLGAIGWYLGQDGGGGVTGIAEADGPVAAAREQPVELPSEPVAPAPVPAAPDPEPPEEPEAQPEATPEPTQSPEPAPAVAAAAAPAPTAPAPSPSPAPAPAPKPAPAPSVATLIERGWGEAEGNPAAARGHFERALAASPRNNEANYGYGYVLLKLDQAEGARTHLCKALVGAPIDIQREVTALLERNGLACN